MEISHRLSENFTHGNYSGKTVIQTSHDKENGTRVFLSKIVLGCLGFRFETLRTV